MATPFDGETFTFTQPDGTSFEVRGWGNQHSAVFETLDGYTVVQDPDSGYYRFAEVTPDGERLRPGAGMAGASPPPGLRRGARTRQPSASRMRSRGGLESQPSRWQQRRANTQSQLRAARSGAILGAPPAQTTVGTFVGLCILVEFPDVPHEIERPDVEQFCNEVGYSGFGNNGSVHDYFLEVSNGKVRYTNIVTDWYMASNPRSYYTDPGVQYGSRARELIREALDHLVDQGFDFQQLTADAGGFVYATNVYYAGTRSNNWGEGLWPHQSSLGVPYQITGGRKMMDYQVTDMTPNLTLGTFCHENGHMICDFPDLYDYDGDSQGVGRYCLMCAGGQNRTNPAHVGAYLKYKAGWLDNVRAYTQGQPATLSAATDEVIIHNKNADEYFLIENRDRSGRDVSLPSTGLAVWHVDEEGNNRFQQGTPSQHYECAIKQADGRRDLELNVNLGDPSDLYSSATSALFGDATLPNSRWWDGSASGLELSGIGAAGPAVSLFMGEDAGAGGGGALITGSVSPGSDIPDDSPLGIGSIISIDASAGVGSIEVDVDITHTYRGDLRVTLVAPSGASAVLHNRTGGRADNLVETYTIANAPGLGVLAGQATQGAWVLQVADVAAQDEGVLNSWSLRIAPQDSPLVRFAESPGAKIEDQRRTRREIVSGGDGTVGTVQVNLDITHSYIGDLLVRLTAPSGESAIIHNRQGGSSANIIGEFDEASVPALADLNGTTIAGTWALEVSDLAQQDEGKLNRWEVIITPA